MAIQTLTLNVNAQPSAEDRAFLYLSQNENGRDIRFRVLGDDLPSGCTATLSGVKPDGNVWSKAGTVTNNFVVVEEDIQMTAVAGRWDAQLDIVNGSKNIVTALIRITVEAAAVEAGAVPSDTQLEGYVEQCKQYAESAKNEAYGSPLTAATAAAMTDQRRVYVYTGSETGYTAGHWYYHNGTSWTDGGVYNAVAVDTDTTLSVSGKAADAKKTGDEISQIKEELKHQINSEIIEFTEGGYIVTNGSTVDTSDIIENSDWAYAIVDCIGGDYFSIKCYGGDSPRAYAIINNDGDVIEKSSPGTVTASLVIPDGATKIVLNTQIAYPSLSYKGEPIPNILFNMISDSADATGVLPITTAKRGYISIGTIAIGSLVSLSAVYYPNCTYSVIDCNEGDLFIVNGTGANNGRLYGILDANNRLLKKSVKNLTAKDLIVEIPPNGKKFIINHVGDSDTCFRISDTMAMANYKNGFKTNKVQAQKYTYAITGSTSSYQIVFNSSYVGFVAPVEPNTYYYISNPGGNRFRMGSTSFDPLSLDFTSKNGDGLTIADDSASYLVFKTLSTDRYITVYCSSSSENINDISISRGIYQNNNTEITNYVLKSKYTIGYSLFDNGALYNSNDTYSNKWASTDISDLYNIYDGLVSDFPGYVSKELFCTDTAGNNAYIYHFTNKEYATLGPANIKGKNKKIFIICGTHGYERMPMFSAAKLFDKICRNWGSDPALEMLRWNIDFDVIPCLNVYGYINGTRKNENGVDLNRNYSEGWDKATSSMYTDPNSANYKGTAPFSEVQTSAVKNYFSANYSDIIFAIDFHYSSSFSYITVQQEAIPLFASWKRLCDIWLMKLNEFSLISSDRNYVAIKNFYDLGSTAYWLNTLDVPSVLLESCGNIGTTNSGKDTEDFATTTLSNLILSRLRID